MKMDFQPNDSLLRDELIKRLLSIEQQLSADVISFTGAIHEGYSSKVLGVIEDLAKTK